MRLQELRTRPRLPTPRSAWSDAHASLTQVDRASPGWAQPDLELLGTAAFMLGRDDEFVTLLERAHHAHLQDDERLRAVRCAFWLAAHLSAQGDLSCGERVAWSGRAAARGPGGRLRRARLPADPGHVPARGLRRLRGRGGDGRRRGRVRAALRRPGPLLARDPRAGTDADQRRADARGPRTPRRGDGRSHRRRRLADGQRPRLLRRDPRLPAGLRAPPGPRVDGRPLHGGASNSRISSLSPADA